MRLIFHGGSLKISLLSCREWFSIFIVAKVNREYASILKLDRSVTARWFHSKFEICIEIFLMLLLMIYE